MDQKKDTQKCFKYFGLNMTENMKGHEKRRKQSQQHKLLEKKVKAIKIWQVG